MSPEKYYTAEEIAEMLRVSRMTIYRFMKSGTIPAIRVGRSFRVAQSDLDAYLKSISTKETP